MRMQDITALIKLLLYNGLNSGRFQCLELRKLDFVVNEVRWQWHRLVLYFSMSGRSWILKRKQEGALRKNSVPFAYNV